MPRFFPLAFLAACLACAPAARADDWQLSQSAVLLDVSKLSFAEQDKQIERVYNLLPSIGGEIEWRAQSPNLVTVTTGAPPEELELEARLALARAMLLQHGDSAALLFHRSLSSNVEPVQMSGLRGLMLLLPDARDQSERRADALSGMSQKSRDLIYRDLAAIYRAEPGKAGDAVTSPMLLLAPELTLTLRQRAEFALTQLGDARAIALFIADVPAHPTRNFWMIEPLALQTPNDPALRQLVPFLTSPNQELRIEAMIALPVSSVAVQEAVPRLLDDPDAAIREFAVYQAFQLAPPQFEALQKQLQSKLADPSPSVRLKAALEFARRKNPVAAPVLLARLREQPKDTNPDFISKTLNELIGFDAGYVDSASMAAKKWDEQEVKRRNDAAFARIEQWIAAHPAP